MSLPDVTFSTDKEIKMKKRYKNTGCYKCTNGYILHPGQQYTPYHSGSGWYERCVCSKINRKKYQAILDDMSLTRDEFNKLISEYYDNNYNKRYEQ